MTWWTPVELADRQERYARVGPLHLRVAREGELYRIAWRRDEGQGELGAVVGDVAAISPLEPGWTVRRVVPPTPHDTIRFRPLVADRPIVARPEVPLEVAPMTATMVYVSTPLWVTVETSARLIDLPALRAKPTWFGTRTEGGPCYAMRTRMRLDITEVIPRPHRAVVALRLVNAGSDPLVVERVRIPVPNLAIYEGSDERLVLPDITLTREDDPSQARVRLDKRQMGSRVADAREPWVDNAVVRAFNSVFR